MGKKKPRDYFIATIAIETLGSPWPLADTDLATPLYQIVSSSKMASASDKTRISVLCSGSGSNLQAIIDSCASGRIADGEIVRVTVNRKTAFSQQRAEKAGIPTAYFNMVAEKFHAAGEKDLEKLKEARLRYDAALAERILQDKPELVVLAGWMHVFTVNFLNPIKAAGVPIINLHPALPGESSSFPRARVGSSRGGNMTNLETPLISQASMTVRAQSRGHIATSRPASWRTTRRAS